MKSSDAGAYCNLGIALRTKGELAESIAAFRKARDRAQRGSDLALLIAFGQTRLGAAVAWPPDRI